MLARWKTRKVSSNDLIDSSFDFLGLCRIAKPCHGISLAIKHVASIKIPRYLARKFGLAQLHDGVGVIAVYLRTLGNDELVGACEGKRLDLVGGAILLP